jgi:hypothetical protein
MGLIIKDPLSLNTCPLPLTAKTYICTVREYSHFSFGTHR